MRQLIIARKDLNMSPGKLAAQVSHASMAFLSNMIRHGGLQKRVSLDTGEMERYEFMITMDPAIYDPREKHMLSETLDAKAFKALGVGDAPFHRQPIEEDEYKDVMTDKTENETVVRRFAQYSADTGLDAGNEFDGVC